MATTKLTKPQVLAALAEQSGLDKGTVSRVLEALTALAAKQLGKSGPGELTIPGLVKLKAKTTPATPEKPGINPFTKEPTVIKAKPASVKVKASPVKQLKEAATK